MTCGAAARSHASFGLAQRMVSTGQGQYLRAVVAGHGRYFGVPDNWARLSAFRFQVGRLWHRTLCPRNQTHHLIWRRMHRVIEHWLSVPHICHPYPNQRLIVMTQGRSRMRWLRSYGSVDGVPGDWYSNSDL